MKQLDSKAVWLFFINFILRWFFLIVFLMFWAWPLFFTLQVAPDLVPENYILGVIIRALIFLVVFVVLCFIWAKLTYRFYRYELTEDGFRKELGVIYKKYVTIPYDRIQNVDIYRGIWSRILGLSDLNIQTAGASAVVNRNGAWGVGSEGRLPALSREVAEQLRDELIKRAKQSKNQGL
jgi:uncharacterized membrane protein YdbT with pleckstrin-like domain